MIILIEGDINTGKTSFCKEFLNSARATAAVNDSSTRVEVDEICRRRNQIPNEVVIITGDAQTIEYAERTFRAANRAEPVFRLEIKEPNF